MASDLPEEFDVIVLGTGLSECILAAAFSRIGLSVLHLDRNDYYCGSWASFSLRKIPDWIEEQKKAKCYSSAVEGDQLSALLKEGERALQLPETFETVCNADCRYHVGERPAEKPREEEPCVPPEAQAPLDNAAKKAINSTSPDPTPSPAPSQRESDPAGSQPGPVSSSGAQETDESIAVISGQLSAEETDKSSGIVPGQFDSAAECSEDESETEAETEKETERRQWFREDVEKEWRRFNLDLAPKLLYCSGSMVELLIRSDVAKYVEFRTVSRVLAVTQDSKLEKVPCSRADVFSTKALSLLEKRLLMKFLSFAAEFDKHPQEFTDYLEKPFLEFLASKKLSPRIQYFILRSLAMATEATTTAEGLENTQKFLLSIGRYGNTAFLFPLYGSGELPQGFCRMSAVFGGIYVLTLSASHLLLDADNRCTGVITSAGQRISCKYVIADPSYLPQDFYSVSQSRQISRGIYVTDTTIFPGEAEDLSLLQLPHGGQPSSPFTTVLELPPSAMVTPRQFYVVHMTRTTVFDAPSDLKTAEDMLFESTQQPAEDSSKEEGTDEDRPRVLWSLYFQQRDLSSVTRSQAAPANVFVTSGPGTELDTDRCVLEAKAIFTEVCPEEEFLPKPPHPDDIIYVDTEEKSTTDAPQAGWISEQQDNSNQDTPSRATDSEPQDGLQDKEDSSHKDTPSQPQEASSCLEAIPPVEEISRLAISQRGRVADTSVLHTEVGENGEKEAKANDCGDTEKKDVVNQQGDGCEETNADHSRKGAAREDSCRGDPAVVREEARDTGHDAES